MVVFRLHPAIKETTFERGALNKTRRNRADEFELDIAPRRLMRRLTSEQTRQHHERAAWCGA